jgi:radical SAM superfamily enzyme YgiQ (UPF0313 family)
MIAARRALLVSPLQAEVSLALSYKSIDETVRIMGCSCSNPPLGLLSAAACLPPDWQLRLVDQNLDDITEADWAFADIVLISGYNDQAAAQAEVIAEAKRRGIMTVVGGGWASLVPDKVQAAGADFVVVDEAELGLPILLEQLEQGVTGGIIRPKGNANINKVPVPRFDLVDMTRYAMATVQYSRGCPFKCEYCDVINKGIGGTSLRAKRPEQFIAELDALYDSGWRGAVFIADDNFIGDRKQVRLLMPHLIEWMKRKRYPFTLISECSINIALDQKLMDQMVEAGITRMFVGIESVDHDALEAANKRQNMALPIVEACRRMAEAGIEVMAGLVLGFDDEPAGAGERLQRMVEEAPIAVSDLYFLVALPQAAMWTRMEKENRLRTGSKLRPTGPPPLNFVTQRPASEILREGIEFARHNFRPDTMLERTWGQHRYLAKARNRQQAPITPGDWRSFAHVFWRYGVKRDCRMRFWRALLDLVPSGRGIVTSFLRGLSLGETYVALQEPTLAMWADCLAERQSEEETALAMSRNVPHLAAAS